MRREKKGWGDNNMTHKKNTRSFRLVGIILCASFFVGSSLAQGSLDPEFRVRLTRNGLHRLLPKFPTATKTRHDIYFDAFCDGEFVSSSLPNPHKLRIKERSTEKTFQFSRMQDLFSLQELGTPISYRISESDEETLTKGDALLKEAKRFLSAAARPSTSAATLVSLGTEVHTLYRKSSFPGRSAMLPYLNNPSCLLIPAGENTKTRHAMPFKTSDGTRLKVQLGSTVELNEEGQRIELYELEADPEQGDDAYRLNRELVAHELIDFLTDGQGLTAEEVSNQSSTTGLYIQKRMREAPALPITL